MVKTFVEVNHGFVRCVLEGVDNPPYGMVGVEFVDITDLPDPPKVGWLYDAGSQEFSPNPYGADPYHPEMIEEAWRLVRNSRGVMLNMSDYTQMPDFPNWILKRKYKIYRQSLRDLPIFFDDPYTVEYPAEPKISNLTTIERLWLVWNEFRESRIRSRG